MEYELILQVAHDDSNPQLIRAGNCYFQVKEEY